MASCDLAIASEAATFATPGVDIGLFCSTPMVALSRNVPRKQAMEMLLTGEPIPASTRARDRARQSRRRRRHRTRRRHRAGRKVALKSAYTVKLGKEAFYRQAEMSLADAYRYAAEVMTENMMARDAEEGIGAFIEKRDADMAGQVIPSLRATAKQSRIASEGSDPDCVASSLRAARNDSKKMSPKDSK